MTVDEFGRCYYSIKDIIELLYARPDFDISQIAIEKTECHKWNQYCEELLEEMKILSDHNTITDNIEDFHKMKLGAWFMPQEYIEFDIEKFVLDQCTSAEETIRANDELMMFSQRNLIIVLKYIKYVVDTMRANHIVWGVGRGSSLASFVLFLIGINKVNPLLHNLDIHEFLR